MPSMTPPQPVKLWRSREELEATAPASPLQSMDRRTMLSLMGASLALAGLSACTRSPDEEIVPYVRAPEDFVPGHPLFYATAMSLGGFAKGLLVESHLGRPTKVEGNPDHPASLGATDTFAQASVLTLYDPDRSQAVTHAGRISTWQAFVTALATARDEQRQKNGAGLRILTERTTSPTLIDQITGLLAQFPRAKWYQYEPVTRDNARAGARLAFGRDVHTRHHIDRADVIVALDSDFLGTGPANLRDTRHFASRRLPRDGQTMNRLYVVESTPSITGTMADHRLQTRSLDVEAAAQLLAQAVAGRQINADSQPTGSQAPGSQAPGSQAPASQDASGLRAFIQAASRDLLEHRGASLVMVGDSQPARVHALGHAINAFLGNEGKTIDYTDPVEPSTGDDLPSLRELIGDMTQGEVDLLIILGGNPVFTAPRDLAFAQALSHVGFRVHLSLYQDETSGLCDWHIPEAHYLEAWGDACAFDGTASIVQPLIAPLYGGVSSLELLATFAGASPGSGYDIVREYWRKRMPGPFEQRWQRALNDGLVADSALPAKTVPLQTTLETLLTQPAPRQAPGPELVFRPDPTIWDGRFANNAWLQELPKPLTKLTWDGAALISPAMGRRLGLENGDVVDVEYQGARIHAPVWILPGQTNETVTFTMGYGRRRGGRVATGVGFNAYDVRTSGAPWFGRVLEIVKTGERYDLISTQHHFDMEGRDLIRASTIEEFTRHPRFATDAEGTGPQLESLYPGYSYHGHAWGLTVDLNACIGCGACVVACQAENNIPVVGKEEVGRGRSMHWIRIDRYYEGTIDDPTLSHEPVMCMHCENAPCELVCPVGATVHSDEGLNQMVYNRCVGTRYCSNNCPYKVRRFNFFQYADWNTPSLKGLRNPDVTVRSRGVMEKCSYCVQRINQAKIAADKAERPIRDGEIVTACQAVCPAQAIVFGDLNEPGSRVATLRADPRNYGLLTDLNTRPRTTYLARLRNPNPALPKENEAEARHGS